MGVKILSILFGLVKILSYLCIKFPTILLKFLQRYNKKMKNTTIIEMPYGAGQVLKKEFNCHDSFVSAALHGKAKSLRALKIRKRAKEILRELEADN